MDTSSYKDELPVNTLDMSDLLMQFKVMKALGYQSLFDEGFRRELRNPFRKMLYYRLVSADESMDAVLLQQALKNTSDRIGFFTNPELAKKVYEKEMQDKMTDEDFAGDLIAQKQAEFERLRKMRGDI